MKKILLLLLPALCAATYTFAQKDVAAKAILAQVSANYKIYDVVKTDFTFTLENKQAGVTDTQYGTLISKSKSNKFKVSIYGSQAGGQANIAQEIISDGKTQWTYLKKDNEVQVANVDNSGEGLNPAQVFTIY